MTTSYVFTHKRNRDEHRVLHLGKHLVTDSDDLGYVIQKFDDDAAAKAHIDRLIALRKRTGYAVREIEQAPETVILPRELSGDPLLELVCWASKNPRRLAVLLKGKESPQTRTAIVERIQREKPSLLNIDFSSKSPSNTHFVQHFLGKSLPTVRSLILSQEIDSLLDPHDLRYGNVTHILATMPGLQRVFLNGFLPLSPFQHSALTELHLYGDPLRPANVDALAGCSLPALQKLRIMLCELKRNQCRIDTCSIALSTLHAPCLEWLHIQGLQDITFFLEGLLRKGLPSCLHTLQLEGEIPDEDALLDVLGRYGDELRKLRNVLLPLLDEVSLCAVERVKEILPCYVEASNVSCLDSQSVYLEW